MNSKVADEGELGIFSGEDLLFIMGLALFIFYLILVHPYTPKFFFDALVFWTSVTVLILSMAPDYFNKKKTQEWWLRYKGTRLRVLYKNIYSVAQSSDKYFNPDKFFVAGFLLTLGAVITLFFTGKIFKSFFGVSYAFLMRAILVPIKFKLRIRGG